MRARARAIVRGARWLTATSLALAVGRRSVNSYRRGMFLSVFLTACESWLAILVRCLTPLRVLMPHWSTWSLFMGAETNRCLNLRKLSLPISPPQISSRDCTMRPSALAAPTAASHTTCSRLRGHPAPPWVCAKYAWTSEFSLSSCACAPVSLVDRYKAMKAASNLATPTLSVSYSFCRVASTAALMPPNASSRPSSWCSPPPLMTTITPLACQSHLFTVKPSPFAALASSWDSSGGLLPVAVTASVARTLHTPLACCVALAMKDRMKSDFSHAASLVVRRKRSLYVRGTLG
mmetsp:Transcript_26941/g.67098  ORF Transcript_26941/g.67098 Transcript_26941/m.67098 type:complete len:292 (-) Transcript_26941:829-1704(-)